MGECAAGVEEARPSALLGRLNGIVTCKRRSLYGSRTAGRGRVGTSIGLPAKEDEGRKGDCRLNWTDLEIVKMLDTAERDGRERTVSERRKVSAIGACMTPARAKKQVMRMVVKIMLCKRMLCARVLFEMMMVGSKEETHRVEAI